MVGNKINGVLFTTRQDGVNLYRFAVPNEKDKDGAWIPPKKKILQEQTGILYDEAIDIEGGKYTYLETDIPVNPEPEPEPEPEPDALTVADTLNMLNELGVNTDD